MGNVISRLIAVIVIALLCATQAPASVLLSDDFASYNSSQAAFDAAWTPSGTSGGVVLSGVELSVTGPPSDGRRSQKSFAEFMPTAAEDLQISFRIQVNSTSLARHYIDLMDGAGSSSGQLLELGINNSPASNEWFVRMLGSSEANAFVPMDPAAPDRVPNQWADLRAVIHRETATTGSATVFVNDVPGKMLSGFTLRSYDTVRIGSNLSSAGLVWFDDVLVQTVPAPEPTALGVIGAVAVVGALCRRRRR